MDKYRIDTWRYPNWDYSGAGVYFITICTKNRRKYFGEIISADKSDKCFIKYSDLGIIANKYWQDIP